MIKSGDEKFLTLSMTQIRDNMRDFFESEMYFLTKRQIRQLIDKQLKHYFLVEDFEFLRVGSIIRTATESEDRRPSNLLTRPCILVDIKMTDEGMSLKCKSLSSNSKTNYPLFFHISAEKSYIFQKLTRDQVILLQALDNI
jgi:hypothetical protein